MGGPTFDVKNYFDLTKGTSINEHTEKSPQNMSWAIKENLYLEWRTSALETEWIKLIIIFSQAPIFRILLDYSHLFK